MAVGVEVVGLQPKQEELLNLILWSPKTKIMFGGSNGSGKSAAIRLINLILCVRVKKHPVRTLIFRRKSNDLLENHIIPFFQSYPATEKYFNKTERMIYWPDGSTTKFGASDAEKDIADYEGKEYDYIFIDEATHATQYQMEYLASRCRSGNYKAKMIFTTIPGGVSHNYLKRLFLTKKYEENENPDEYFFLPARVWDNVVWSERALAEQGYSAKEYYYEWSDERRREFCLQYSDYAQTLSHLPETKKRARLYGDWDVIEGNFFETWDSEVHIVKPKDYLLYGQLLEWAVGAGLDYGNTTVMEWMARDFNGNYIMFDELYQHKMSRSKKIEQTLEFMNHRGLSDRLVIADTNMWIKDAFDVDNATMPAQDYIKAGVRLLAVSKSSQSKNRSYRENCNDNMKDVLDYDMDDSGKITKPPKLLVYERCGNFIENFPTLLTDPNNPDDIADGQEDHCFTGDTPVYTKEGQKPIRKIKVGDEVLTRKGYKKVLVVHKQKNKYVKHYPELGLTATSNHPIITKFDKLIKISELTYSDFITTLTLYDGATLTNTIGHIDNHDKIKSKFVGYRTVYNLTVEDCHEYYANNILVHNCYDAAKYILMYLRQPYQKVDEQAYLRSLNRPTAYTGKAKSGQLNDKSLRM